MEFEAALRAGAAELGVALTDGQVALLLSYAELIRKWSRVYNLTSLRSGDEILSHHLLDSLAAILPLRRQAPEAHRVLDVGSGAGLPGVVIAICCPGVQVDCVDAVAKKAAFIQQVAAQLNLANLRGLHARVESLPGPYDVVCSRAFASLQDFVTWSAKARAADGIWLAMKGKRPDEEIAALPPGVQVFHVEPLTVPGLAAQRCIVWMRPAPAEA